MLWLVFVKSFSWPNFMLAFLCHASRIKNVRNNLYRSMFRMNNFLISSHLKLLPFNCSKFLSYQKRFPFIFLFLQWIFRPTRIEAQKFVLVVFLFLARFKLYWWLEMYIFSLNILLTFSCFFLIFSLIFLMKLKKPLEDTKYIL